MSRRRDATFEQHFREHHPRVVASLALSFGDVELARDAAAEAFAKACSRWAKVRDYDSPRGWTYTVAFNVARRAVRRRGQEVGLATRYRVDHVVAGPEVAGIWERLDELPERQRIAVVLRYADDLTEAQIATVMGVTRSTVSSALIAARTTLAGLLAEEADVDRPHDPVEEAQPWT